MPAKKHEPIRPGDSKYLTINVIARRAKELARTKKPTLPYSEENFEPIDVASEELYADHLKIQVKDEVSGEIEDFKSID